MYKKPALLFLLSLLMVSSTFGQLPFGPPERPFIDSFFKTVGTVPHFPGGRAYLNSYIQRWVRYPEQDAITQREATVWVTFTVNTNGRVSNVHHVPPPPTYLGQIPSREMVEEVMRTVKGMPSWIYPIYVVNRAPMRVTLPVTFKLRSKW